MTKLAQLDLSEIAVVEEATPVAEIGRLFVDLRIPAIAVIDDEDCLRGLITRTDVLRSIDAPMATAEDVMSCYVLSLPASSSIECAAALMATEGVGQIVVTAESGEALGVVTALDVARHVATRAGYLAA